MPGESSLHLYANEAERANAMALAWEYRLKGRTYKVIAEDLGCSIPTAKKLLDEYRHEIMPREEIEAWQDISLAHLDHLLERAETLVSSQDPEIVAKGIAQALRINESRRSLLGLDAVKKAELKVTVQTEQEEEFAPVFKMWDERNKKVIEGTVVDGTEEQA